MINGDMYDATSKVLFISFYKTKTLTVLMSMLIRDLMLSFELNQTPAFYPLHLTTACTCIVLLYLLIYYV